MAPWKFCAFRKTLLNTAAVMMGRLAFTLMASASTRGANCLRASPSWPVLTYFTAFGPHFSNSPSFALFADVNGR